MPLKLDIAVRWEETGWTAYNVGARPPHAERNWSTRLGDITQEEVQTLFRNSNLLWLPPAARADEKGYSLPLDFTPYN
jgi:hypothetical protein